MKDLITEFQKASKLFVDTINKFPIEKRETILFDQWSLKDILAHILGWHKLFLINLSNLTNDNAPVDWGKIDEFNRKNVSRNQSSSFSSIFQDLKKTDQELIKQLESLTLQNWQKKFWPNRTYTPQKILEIEIKHYLHTHIPQINNFKLEID